MKQETSIQFGFISRRLCLAVAVVAVSLAVVWGSWRAIAADGGDSANAAEADSAAASDGLLPVPFLWRVEKGDREKPSYLFGTIHIANPRVLDKAEQVDWAIRDSDGVFTELSMDLASQAEGANMMMLPPDKNLNDVLPKALSQRLNKYLKKKRESLPIFIRPVADTILQQKPWAAAMNLGMLEIMEEMMGGVLDQVIFARGRELGKDVGGVELMIEQVGIFDDLPLEEQILMLEGTLEYLSKEDVDTKADFHKLMEAYLSGDEEVLVETLESEEGKILGLADEEKYKALTEKLEKKLLEDRNNTMADRMGAMMKENPDKGYFFAVGLAHYPGEKGVVALLEAKGFEVERVSREDFAARGFLFREGHEDQSDEEVVAPPPGSLAARLGVGENNDASDEEE
jgi:uncharacterized protein YbaP (TraB family)